MAALTAGYEAGYKPGHIVLYGVAEETTIYKGGLVALNTDGYLVPLTHETEDLRYVGVAEETVVNEGADGAAGVRVSKQGTFVYACSATQADVGAVVYCVDDATVQTLADGLDNEYIVGTILKIENTSKGSAGVRIRIGNHTV